MRAREFLSEVTNAKIAPRRQMATRGLHIFGDTEHWNADYVMNRIGMAVAGSDGKNMQPLDAKSWSGKNKTAHPYTPEEEAMLKMAYRAVGANYRDLNDGDLRSEELSGTNTKSPIQAFRGYPR